jgi:hypothetical protein
MWRPVVYVQNLCASIRAFVLVKHVNTPLRSDRAPLATSTAEGPGLVRTGA